MEKNMKTLCGIFENTSKKGTKYLSGKVQEGITLQPGQKFMLFENKKKDPAKKSPQYYLCVTDPVVASNATEGDLGW